MFHFQRNHRIVGNVKKMSPGKVAKRKKDFEELQFIGKISPHLKQIKSISMNTFRVTFKLMAFSYKWKASYQVKIHII